MKLTIGCSIARRSSRCFAAVLLTSIGGCGALRSTQPESPSVYALDRVQIESTVATRPPAAAPLLPAPTLIVSPPSAASGFDSRRIVYQREPHRVEYFAHSEWVDTPARMLAPLIVVALERTAAFNAVALTPSSATGDLRLDTDIVRLEHDFAAQPSRVRFTLRAYVVDVASGAILASRELEASVAAASEDPYGGVAAANGAVGAVLEQLAGFCAEAARRWRPATVGRARETS